MGINRKLRELISLLNLEKFTFVDIGAAGEFNKRWEALRERLFLIGFEPNKEEFKKLMKNKSGENIKYYNCCVDREASPVNYFVCRQKTTSSCLKPNYEFLRRFPMSERFDLIEEVSLMAESLDGLLSSEKVDFIKIDTQGSELNILKGGAQILKDVCGLEVEIEFSPHYQDQPLFADVDSYLRELGFSLFDLRPCYWKRSVRQSKGRGQIIFADALYFRDYAMSDVIPKRISPIVIAAVLYAKFDFALEIVDYFHKMGKLSSEDAERIRSIILSLAKPLLRIPDFKGRTKIISCFEKMTDWLKSACWTRYEPWR